ncbi:MAG: hypothetical protein PSN34_13215 [Urechidicola sp.]|nr:hypothetical protein [Urechidicola sp.]
MANIQKVALKKVEGCINEIQSKGLKYTEQADRVEKMPNMGKNLPIIKGIIGSHPLNETWEYRPGGKGNKLRIFIGVKDDDPSMAYLLLVDPKHEYSK